nr:insulin isoform UC [Homo sapiens]
MGSETIKPAGAQQPSALQDRLHQKRPSSRSVPRAFASGGLRIPGWLDPRSLSFCHGPVDAPPAPAGAAGPLGT